MKIAFARSSIALNPKRPHSKAEEPECLSRPYTGGHFMFVTEKEMLTRFLDSIDKEIKVLL